MTSRRPELHVGTHNPLADRSLDFQLDRWIAYGGDSMLADVRGVLDRLAMLADQLARDLAAAGAIPPAIRIELVEAVPRTALGKAPLVVARRPAGQRPEPVTGGGPKRSR